MANAKNTVCIWYDTGAEEAANFYAATFPDTRVIAVHRAPSDNPSTKAGGAMRDPNKMLQAQLTATAAEFVTWWRGAS